jgi:hypothetical protein
MSDFIIIAKDVSGATIVARNPEIDADKMNIQNDPSTDVALYTAARDLEQPGGGVIVQVSFGDVERLFQLPGATIVDGFLQVPSDSVSAGDFKACLISQQQLQQQASQDSTGTDTTEAASSPVPPFDDAQQGGGGAAVLLQRQGTATGDRLNTPASGSAQTVWPSYGEGSYGAAGAAVGNEDAQHSLLDTDDTAETAGSAL